MAKILIIDDANFTRTMLKRIIAEFGHETIEASNGREGLDKICSDKRKYRSHLASLTIP